MRLPERGRAAIELARPGNAVAAGALTFVGAFVADGGLEASRAVLAAIGATMFAVAGGNAINDYFDRDVDAINDPDRPIPRGAISPRGALVYSTALFLGAIGLALVLPPLAVGIAAVNLLALISYTELFKGTPGAGNVLVAYLVGSTFLFGGAAVGSVEAAGVLCVLAALATVAREIIKDVEDLAGDTAEGLRTVPALLGEKRAIRIAGGVLALALLASPVPYLLELFDETYLLVVAPADLLMAYAFVLSRHDPGRGQRVLKYGMFLAVLAFVAGRAAIVL